MLTMSSHLAYPRKGHLECALHMMGYLKWKHNSRLFFDPTYPDIEFNTFNDGAEWKTFYGDVTKAMTRRSRTGYLIFLNTALIDWLSKKQTTIKGSLFRSESVAMKTVVEAIRGIRYKLHMMGVPLTGPTDIFGNNMSFIYNISRPESTLKKKINSICYHAVREAVASGKCLTTHCKTGDNYSDMMTKVLYKQKKRDNVARILYDI